MVRAPRRLSPAQGKQVPQAVPEAAQPTEGPGSQRFHGGTKAAPGRASLQGLQVTPRKRGSTRRLPKIWQLNRCRIPPLPQPQGRLLGGGKELVAVVKAGVGQGSLRGRSYRRTLRGKLKGRGFPGGKRLRRGVPGAFAQGGGGRRISVGKIPLGIPLTVARPRLGRGGTRTAAKDEKATPT